MGDGSPKYLNSKETKLFDKSRNLYGLNFARSSRKKEIILCEGYMDVISMHQAGVVMGRCLRDIQRMSFCHLTVMRRGSERYCERYRS